MRNVIKRYYNKIKKWAIRTRIGTSLKLRRASDDELEMRRVMVNSAIRYVMREGDPYDSVINYREQHKRILSEIRRRNKSKDKPPRTEIKAKPGYLTGKGR